jgi:hypothetical protein
VAAARRSTRIASSNCSRVPATETARSPQAEQRGLLDLGARDRRLVAGAHRATPARRP